ncbi:MAG: type I glutamate--ammonia ligase [Acidimicrobiales bacterium]
MKPRTPAEVVRLLESESIEIVDVRFCDLPGMMQHFSAPAHMLDEEVFTEGFGFDGSSIRGFQQIHESDMLLMPDPNTAYVDPFREHKTLNINCFVSDPVTGEPYSRDPRYVAKKAEEHLKTTGVADTAYFGPEAEFFIFDEVRYGQGVNYASYQVDSIEGHWNTGVEDLPNQGYKLRPKEGYFPVPPSDHFQDLRSEMILIMEQLGIEIEIQHHEVATGGQAEIDMKFDTLLRMADKLMLYKYVVKNVAYQAGFTATFMPKPLYEDNGSGMHTHQSLWNGGQPLFAGDGYAGFSDIGRWYIGGILKHAPAVLGFAAPTTNSYKRLVPGYEAPVNLVYSQRNRSAACRIPLYSKSPKAKRVEFRCPDASSNPYLAFAAQLMAGLDGVVNKIEPPEPLQVDLFDLEPEELAKIPHTPGSLEEALDALEADQEFLKVGGVFTDDLIDTWLSYKRTEEADQIRLRPHPWEFALYYDI